MTLRSTLTAAAFGLAAMLAAITAAPAQTPSKAQLASARAMMTASGADQTLEVIIPNFIEEARRLVAETNPQLDKPLAESALAIAPQMNQRREDLMNSVAAMYARRFTIQEMDQITAFYNSPTGKKMLATLPGVGVETREYLADWSRTLSTDVITAFRAEMKKRGHDM